MRRLVVGDDTWWYRVASPYSGDGATLVRDDRAVVVRLTPYARDALAVIVRTKVIPWLVAADGGSYAFRIPATESWLLPSTLRRVIELCMDPAAPREPLRAAPPATPREPRGRVLPDALVAHVEAVLGRSLGARPLDPVSRDPPRARRLLARLWESLATQGLVPERWAADGRRRFLVDPARLLDDDEVGSVPWEDGALATLPTPPSMQCLLAVAADPAGLEASEALAREALGRFGALCAGTEQPEATAWCAQGDAWALDGATLASVTTRPWESVRVALRAALAGVGDDPPREGDALVARAARPYSPHRVLQALDEEDARRWARACVQGARVPATAGVRARHVGCTFAELPDPWAPLVEAWARGYGLAAVCGEAAVMVAQAADVPPLVR